MVLTIYLCGWVTTSGLALLVARHRWRSERTVVALIAMLAGMLWPVVAVAGLQAAVIVVATKWVRSRDSELPHAAPAEERELAGAR